MLKSCPKTPAKKTQKGEGAKKKIKKLKKKLTTTITDNYPQNAKENLLFRKRERGPPPINK